MELALNALEKIRFLAVEKPPVEQTAAALINLNLVILRPRDRGMSLVERTMVFSHNILSCYGDYLSKVTLKSKLRQFHLYIT